MTRQLNNSDNTKKKKIENNQLHENVGYCQQ